jgi:hypothetical protein
MHTSVITRDGQINTWCLWRIVYIHIAQCWGQDRTLRHPCLCFSRRGHFAFNKTVNFRQNRKELISLIKFIENFNLYSLYNKPVCQRLFLISKNTTAVGMLLLKFNNSSLIVACVFGCRGSVFTESFPSNSCLLWLNYSGFKQTCHSIITLRSTANVKQVPFIFQPLKLLPKGWNM